MMKLKALTAGLVLGALACAFPSFAQQGDTVAAQAVVTVVPKSGEAPNLPQQSLKVWADGKESDVTQWQPLRGDPRTRICRPHRRLRPLQHRPPAQRLVEVHPVDAANDARRRCL